jgi:6-phosphofructokinase 1
MRAESGRHFSIIAVAEGAFPKDGSKVYYRSGDERTVARLGGISQAVGEFVADVCSMETRVTILGHLQRGGQPTAFDRWLATRFGAAAIRAAMDAKHGCMVSLHGEKVVEVTLEEALAVPKRVDVDGDAVQTARGLGISLGDE